MIGQFARRCAGFMRREAVLSAAMALAAVSAFFVPPSAEYLGYIDWDTLALLFSLMAVMKGFQQAGLFICLANALLSRAHGTRALLAVLVGLPFVGSMIVTNDVALITFVPFGLVSLRMARQERLIVPLVVLQTVAANLGSMLTPMGNPQNLYLYAKSGMSFGSLCLLALFDVLSPLAVAAVTALYLALFDRALLRAVDYSLLGIFAAFFIFIGNISGIEAFRGFISSALTGHVELAAVLASQVTSNVPAALLLSGFTDQWPALIIGCNIGGLGTLIASMASLISYKAVAREYPEQKGRYFAQFTLCNLGLLAVMLGLSMALGAI